MKYLVRVDNRQFEINIKANEPFIEINGQQVEVDLKGLRGGKIQSLLANNINFEFQLEKSNGGFAIWHGSKQSYAEVSDEKSERLKALMGSTDASKKAHSLKAPMPGLVLKIEVEPGQHIKKGDPLVIVEAMKMENELKAHGPAIVREIKVKPGDAVEKNQVLVVFE